MIINTGQRTDIPAFYAGWFANRLKEGFVCVRNPYNPNQVSRYRLDPSVVDVIGFENDRVVRGQIGERSAGRRRLLEAALIRQVDRAVGIELHQRVLGPLPDHFPACEKMVALCVS